MTSSEASSSEEEQCAEDAEVEKIIGKTNGTKSAEAKAKQVISTQSDIHCEHYH